MGTDDLAVAASALSEVGAPLEALDARCARAALEAARRAPGTGCGRSSRGRRRPGGRGGGRANLWGDRPRALDVVRRFVLCASDSGARRIRSTDPLNDPESHAPVARACARGGRGLRPDPDHGPGAGRRPTRSGWRRPGRSRPCPARPRSASRTARATCRRRSWGAWSSGWGGHRLAGGGAGAGPGRPRAAVGDRRRRRRRRGGAGVGGAGRAGGGAALRRDPAGGARRAAGGRSTARPRRSTGRPGWSAPCCRPTGCARRRRPCSAPRWPCPRPRVGADLAPRAPGAVAQPGGRGDRGAAVARDVGAATFAYPLGAAILAQAARHVIYGQPLGRDRARAGPGGPGARGPAARPRPARGAARRRPRPTLARRRCATWRR